MTLRIAACNLATPQPVNRLTSPTATCIFSTAIIGCRELVHRLASLELTTARLPMSAFSERDGRQFTINRSRFTAPLTGVGSVRTARRRTLPAPQAAGLLHLSKEISTVR